MQFERLRKSHKKQIIIGSLAVCVIGGILTFATSRAFYRVDDSIDLAKGTINYKAYDFKIMAMYKSEDKTNYTEIEEMPSEGYVINESKSYCNMSNGNKDETAILKTIDGNHIISKLKKNDKCFIYFDKYISTITIPEIIATLNVNTIVPTFSNPATTDEGVFITDDPMYGTNAKTYYWRGAVTNNYVKFANFCWRIVRINGDETMRLIYDGNSCHANGASDNNIVLLSLEDGKYNNDFDRSEYVGWTYTLGSQRTLTGTSSNAKVQTEKWYNEYIANNEKYVEKISKGKFCNDRSTGTIPSSWSGYISTWSSQGEKFAYNGAKRIYEGTPTLSCSIGDIYELKIGAITADEIVYSGGTAKNYNNLYYLYNDQNYWTMTPVQFNKDQNTPYIFAMTYNGNIGANTVGKDGYSASWRSNFGIRPVINLEFNTTFQSGGDGTLNNPYIVAD